MLNCSKWMQTHKEIICHLEFSNAGWVVSVQKQGEVEVEVAPKLSPRKREKAFICLHFLQAECKQFPLDPNRKTQELSGSLGVCEQGTFPPVGFVYKNTFALPKLSSLNFYLLAATTVFKQ